ncbi:hypothetical protein HNQ37_000023 [Lactovum miscens]|uniref:Uncharacterized protein n=1 Tax=Lactovum miscens TaxID=190387 RepID=A0A841C429_9LACT|nr:hypothetical protein [Lactovum miscens]
MQGYFDTKGKELTYSERQLIERWHNKDKLSVTFRFLSV